METDAEAVHHLSHCRVVDLAVDVSEDVQVSDHDPETLDRWAGQLAALLAEIRAANG
jgi:hypothetical protein